MARGDRIHPVTLNGPGTPVPDGDGGWIETRAALSPDLWWCSIEPATVRDLERLTAGTTLSSASHVLEGDYHSGINTKTQVVTHEGNKFFVNGVVDPKFLHISTIALCQEVVP